MKGFLYRVMMMTGETELNGGVLPHVTICSPQAQTHQWVLTAFFAMFQSRYFVGAFLFF